MILFTHVRAYSRKRMWERGKSMHYQEIKIGFILWENFSEIFIHSFMLTCVLPMKSKKTHTQHISHCVVEATRIFHFCGISSHTHSSLGNNKTCEENFFIHTQTTKKSKFYVQFLGNFLHFNLLYVWSHIKRWWKKIVNNDDKLINL